MTPNPAVQAARVVSPSVALEAQLISNTIVLYTRMPPRRAPKRPYRKRRVVRRRRPMRRRLGMNTRNNVFSAVPMRFPSAHGGKGFVLPSRMRTQMYWTSGRYYDVGFTQGVNDLITLVYSANGIYDPDTITGSGQLAVNRYTLLSSMYAYNRVLRSKIKVTFQPGESIQTANNQKAEFAVFPSTNTTLVTTFAEALTQRGCKSASIRATSGKNPSITLPWYNISSIGGQDPVRYRILSQYSAVTNTNPVSQCFYHVVTKNTSSVETYDSHVRVEIWYDVDWSFPVDSDPTVDQVQGIGASGPSGPLIHGDYLNAVEQLGVTGPAGAFPDNFDCCPTQPEEL